VLDPFFILDMEVLKGTESAGAAISKCHPQGLSAAASFILFRRNQGIKIKLSSMKLEFAGEANV